MASTTTATNSTSTKKTDTNKSKKLNRRQPDTPRKKQPKQRNRQLRPKPCKLTQKVLKCKSDFTVLAGDTERMPAMTEDFNQQVRPFIDLVDHLRQLGLEKDISLPAIVVVGDQSSGKSSVLEALSGIQLPRGSGIVTRCPLVLRMKSCTSDCKWSGRIRYQPQENDSSNDEDNFGVDAKFDDPREVEGRVRTAQILLAGPDRDISTSQISLEISSSEVPDLTLIDLPGITRLVVNGQDRDVSEKIRNMIKDYINKEETIILAVVPANVDIATTESLQMAREVDCEGKRTLGVVTKPDLVDPGAEQELIAVVSNLRYHLRRGYTLVKCRGQQAIANSQTLQEALDEERRFFETHQHFRNLPKTTPGMQNLSKKLTSVLVEHIKENIPTLKAEVRETLEKVNCELLRLGDGLPAERHELLIVLTRTLQLFTETLGKISEGDTRLGDGNNHELNPFKRTREAFHKFAEKVKENIPKENDKRFMEKIKQRIQLTRGRELPRFISYQTCEELIKEIIVKFHQPAKICLAEVNDVIFKITNEVVKKTVGQYRDLERVVKDRIQDMQLKARDVCEKEIKKIFEQEALVYTQDRTYSTTYDCVQEAKQVTPQRTSVSTSLFQSARQVLFSNNYSPDVPLNNEAEHTFDMIKSYMNVCGQRISDTVPMTILFYMVKDLSNTIRTQTWTLLSEDPSGLLSEDPELTVQRQNLRSKAERLQAAQLELQHF